MEPSENRLNEILDAETFTFKGEALETAPRAVGALRRSDEAVGDVDELRRRMQQDGYLFMPGLLNRDQVVGARGRVAQRLAAAGLLDKGHPPEECVAASDAQVNFLPEATRDNAELVKVL